MWGIGEQYWSVVIGPLGRPHSGPGPPPCSRTVLGSRIKCNYLSLLCVLKDMQCEEINFRRNKNKVGSEDSWVRKTLSSVLFCQLVL